jgi:hypothetical protein
MVSGGVPTALSLERTRDTRGAQKLISNTRTEACALSTPLKGTPLESARPRYAVRARFPQSWGRCCDVRPAGVRAHAQRPSGSSNSDPPEPQALEIPYLFPPPVFDVVTEVTRFWTPPPGGSPWRGGSKATKPCSPATIRRSRGRRIVAWLHGFVDFHPPRARPSPRYFFSSP